MQKPNSFGTGRSGTLVSAATVATANYSAGTSFFNEYGDRYVAIQVSSTQAYTLYVFGYDSSFSSVAATGAANGRLLATITGNPANTTSTSPNGITHYVRIAGCKYVLPVLYQSSGSSATVTISYQTFND